MVGEPVKKGGDPLFPGFLKLVRQFVHPCPDVHEIPPGLAHHVAKKQISAKQDISL
jgi:hypothetical protein